MFKLHCKRHYRNLEQHIAGVQRDVNTSRKRRRRDADIRSAAAAAAARRSVMIGGGGVSKMSAARWRRRTALPTGDRSYIHLGIIPTPGDTGTELSAADSRNTFISNIHLTSF